MKAFFHLTAFLNFIVLSAISAEQPASLAISRNRPLAKIKIDDLEIPADCALARKEHPRLLFTKAELPFIRGRIAKPGLKEIYERLKKTVDDQMSQGPARVQAQGAARMLVPLGLLYHITSEEKYGQACRALAVQAPFGVYATEGTFGYDLVYDLLSPDERRACEKKIFSEIDRAYPGPGELAHCVALYGSGYEEEAVARCLSQSREGGIERGLYYNRRACERLPLLHSRYRTGRGNGPTRPDPDRRD